MDRKVRARITAGGAGLVLLAGLGACAVRTGSPAGSYPYVLGAERLNAPASVGVGSAPTALIEAPPSAAAPSETNAVEPAATAMIPAETAPEPGAPVGQDPLVTASAVNPPAGTVVGGSGISSGVTTRASVPKSESFAVQTLPAVAASTVDGAEMPQAEVIADVMPDFAAEMPDSPAELPAAPPAMIAPTTPSSTAVATVASIAPSSAAAPAATATVSPPVTVAPVAATTTSNNSGGGGGDGGGSNSTTTPVATAIPGAVTAAPAPTAVPAATAIPTAIPDATRAPAATTVPAATTIPSTTTDTGAPPISSVLGSTPPVADLNSGTGDVGLGDDVANFDPAATPELGSLALFGSGAAGMGSYLWARLRRRR